MPEAADADNKFKKHCCSAWQLWTECNEKEEENMENT